MSDIIALKVLLSGLRYKCEGIKGALSDIDLALKVVDHMECSECSYGEFIERLKYVVEKTPQSVDAAFNNFINSLAIELGQLS